MIVGVIEGAIRAGKKGHCSNHDDAPPAGHLSTRPNLCKVAITG